MATRAAQLLRRRVLRYARALEPELQSRILKAFEVVRASLTEGELRAILQSGGSVERIVSQIASSDLLDQALYKTSSRVVDGAVEGAKRFNIDLPPLARDGASASGFNLLNPRIIDGLRDLSTQVVSGIKDEIRDTIREEIEAGLKRGVNPRAMARNLRQTIGIAPNQAEWVRNFERQLRNRDMRALRRTLVDKRFAKTIRRTFEDGKRLSEEQINKMVGSYRKRMRAYNAETHARSMALDAQKAGQKLSWEDAIGKGLIDRKRVFKRWSGVDDERRREEHASMEGEVQHMDDEYSNGEDIPGDSTYNCRCISEYFEADPTTQRTGGPITREKGKMAPFEGIRPGETKEEYQARRKRERRQARKAARKQGLTGPRIPKKPKAPPPEAPPRAKPVDTFTTDDVVERLNVKLLGDRRARDLDRFINEGPARVLNAVVGGEERRKYIIRSGLSRKTMPRALGSQTSPMYRPMKGGGQFLNSKGTLRFRIDTTDDFRSFLEKWDRGVRKVGAKKKGFTKKEVDAFGTHVHESLHASSARHARRASDLYRYEPHRFLEEGLVEWKSRRIVGRMVEGADEMYIMRGGAYPRETKFIQSYFRRYGEEAVDELFGASDRYAVLRRRIGRDLREEFGDAYEERFLAMMRTETGEKYFTRNWDRIGKGLIDGDIDDVKYVLDRAPNKSGTKALRGRNLKPGDMDPITGEIIQDVKEKVSPITGQQYKKPFEGIRPGESKEDFQKRRRRERRQARKAAKEGKEPPTYPGPDEITPPPPPPPPPEPAIPEYMNIPTVDTAAEQLMKTISGRNRKRSMAALDLGEKRDMSKLARWIFDDISDGVGSYRMQHFSAKPGKRDAAAYHSGGWFKKNSYRFDKDSPGKMVFSPFSSTGFREFVRKWQAGARMYDEFDLDHVRGFRTYIHEMHHGLTHKARRGRLGYHQEAGRWIEEGWVERRTHKVLEELFQGSYELDPQAVWMYNRIGSYNREVKAAHAFAEYFGEEAFEEVFRAKLRNKVINRYLADEMELLFGSDTVLGAQIKEAADKIRFNDNWMGQKKIAHELEHLVESFQMAKEGMYSPSDMLEWIEEFIEALDEPAPVGGIGYKLGAIGY